jgi:CheY-like chemotaxis protein
LSCILVVDDDQLVREAVSDALLDAGYAVAKATNGTEALDQLAEYPPDAILLDLMMPGMDGWTVLEQIRGDARWQHIPVCLMSAAPIVRRTAHERGVIATVEKPFGVQALLDEVKQLLASGNHPSV